MHSNEAPPQTQSSLAAERRARRAAEEDALRLYNRIRQLQEEDQKAERLIKLTLKRAQDALQHQQRREEEEAARQEREAHLADQVEQQRQRNAQLKQRHQNARYDENVCGATAVGSTTLHFTTAHTPSLKTNPNTTHKPHTH